jgi:hypothetical protein
MGIQLLEIGFYPPKKGNSSNVKCPAHPGAAFAEAAVTIAPQRVTSA